jgi:integrase
LPDSFRPMHGLRHSYASMLASSGQVDLYTLQRLLTHKSPSMTQRYAHLRDEVMQRAAAVAGNIIEASFVKDESGKINKMEQHRNG